MTARGRTTRKVGAYLVARGKVYAMPDGREVHTALTANGRDLENFERALAIAASQRAKP